ncbi:structural maintenance of chromosome protein 3 [Hesseltinella vesiculosa]|uniref:Structural maintenance of chromosomes protein n=1 Tax=Hesseltinella vesiculosa TaxID=101127 RepID=A0A1X2GC17_9FUNG|nr:structural maintenance of chromosome protein 3 [Hesseltinella vesiculosa]
MYIKQIAIQGFKSYKDQTAFDPLSPKHNVIVGRNGSGKSNFFSAIRFVFGDTYNNLTKEQRQSLLHESVGGATISGFVELILDNSDRRLPVEHDEVKIRRTIGLSLDEYSLDGKISTKSDMKSLFESAGLSSANPYFIVPQGRINALTTAKDKDRLELLKQIAGTSLYEEKREESIQLMQQNEIKRTKIRSVLTFIEERLQQLEQEKDQLTQFQDLDSDRRSLEYTIYAREQTDTNAKLEELEELRNRDLYALESVRTELTDNESSLTALATTQEDILTSIDTVESEKSMLLNEMDDLMSRRTQLELDIKDYEDMQVSAIQYKEKIKVALNHLDNEIEHKEHLLADLTPRNDTMQSSEKELNQRLDAVKIDLESLYAKEARLNRVTSKQERDQWLQKQINDSNALRKHLEEQIQSCTEEKHQAEQGVQGAAQRIQLIREKQAKFQQDKTDAMAREVELSNRRDTLMEERKSLWREDAGLSEKITKHKNELRRAEHQLNSSMNKNTAAGLALVQRLVKEHDWQGVYGPLYQLMDVDDRFLTAVEVAAGASLFHVVVDTDETATKLMEAMAAEKSGRVTFVPLNRVKSAIMEYPSASDAIPLIQKLHFDQTYQNAFQQIFARTLVCPNLDIAAKYAKGQGFSVVTLDGDRVDGRGAFTGGYVRLQSTRLEAAKAIKNHGQGFREGQERSKAIQIQVEQLNQQLNQVLSDIVLLGKQKKKTMGDIDTVELNALINRQSQFRTMLQDNEKTLAQAQSSFAQVERQLSNYQAELQSELTQSLSEQEQTAVRQYQATISTLRAELSQLSESKSEVEQQMREIKTLLEQELLPKRNEWLNKQYRLTSDTSVEEFNQQTRELKSIVRRLGRASKLLTEMDQTIDTSNDKHQRMTAEVEELKSLQETLEAKIGKMEKHIERYLYRRSLYLQKKDECSANIRDLGVLPNDAFEKFINLSVDKLLRRLHRANEALQKYTCINKKAFDQYDRFMKLQEQLSTRRSDLDKTSDEIAQLLGNLDRRKNDAIERTFAQVSANFTSVFSKLIPEGHAELVIKKTASAEEDGMEVDERPTPSVKRYSGVAIKASFHQQTDQVQMMQQLSGGQKSLVALALIFAIQQCDPAPFYLFDEIDANLDTQHRAAVADMIHALSNDAQFITTTFRPELLSLADKFYGVTFQNKVSRIHAISKEDAFGFVQEEQPQ